MSLRPKLSLLRNYQEYRAWCIDNGYFSYPDNSTSDYEEQPEKDIEPRCWANRPEYYPCYVVPLVVGVSPRSIRYQFGDSMPHFLYPDDVQTLADELENGRVDGE